MFAVVRFLCDHDNRLHVIPASDIEDFAPDNENDFNNRTVYNAHWRDPVDGVNSGCYSAQVLMLAESENGAHERMRAKRVAIPKIVPDTTDEDEEAAVEAKKKRLKKGNRRMTRLLQKIMYEEILKKNLEEAHRKGKAHKSGAHSKRTRRQSAGSSDTDDDLCSKSELQEMKRQKDFWRSRAQELQADNSFLKQHIQSLQKCLESKIFDVERAQDLHTGSKGTIAAPSAIAAAESPMEEAMEVQNMPWSQVPHSPSAEPRQREEWQCRPESQHVLTAPVPSGDFIFMEDGSFHLTKGIIINGSAAEKILQNKKPTLVVKDTAQAIWGTDVLMERSVTGTAYSRKKASGEKPKPPLTPEKLQVVSATLKHWGALKAVDVASTENGLTRILSEKIQDILKAKLRKPATTCVVQSAN
uniref:BEN domain-containing protein n=1 Tax=Amblyomma maculatum TaxID=34609 RepID=G3MLG9_AMBMU